MEQGPSGKVILVSKAVQKDVSFLDILTFLCLCCVAAVANKWKEKHGSSSMGGNRELSSHGKGSNEEVDG